MNSPSFLQSYICAVCTFSHSKSGGVDVQHLEGSCFFIGKSGVFLTARHVMESAVRRAKDQELNVGLVVKDDNGKSPRSIILSSIIFEYAPGPFDIAIGKSAYFTDSPLKIAKREVHVWQEIATLGYPESARIMDDHNMRINLRAHRGYIQRCTAPQDMQTGAHPNGFELNFLLSPGLSGCPIFTTPDEIVIAVGVGSYRSEQTDSQYTEIREDGTIYSERVIKVEQFGFAHSLSDLLGWKPKILDGKALEEVN